MDEHTVNECKYKNGFEAGYKQGYEEGKRVRSAEAVDTSDRDKLIALLEEAQYNYRHGAGSSIVSHNYADHLLANGVTTQEQVEWIPVTDGLPKTDGRFMVTIKNRGKCRTEMRNFDHRTQTWESASYVSENIVAWQQRPKPYYPSAKQEVE